MILLLKLGAGNYAITLVEPQAKPRGIVFRDVRLNFGEFILLKFTNSRCYPEFFNSHNYVDSPLKKKEN